MYSSEDITIFNTTELSPATTLSDSPPYLTQSGVTNWWNWGYDWTSPEQSSRTSISSTSGGYGSVENSFSQPGFVTSPQATSTPARTRSAYAESSSGSSSNWSYEQGQGTRTRLVQPRPPHEPTRYISISTQFVYSAPQRAPILARVSLTDYRGHLEFDTFVRPTYPVADFRTEITGIRYEHLVSNNAMDAEAVRHQVSVLVSNKIIVGHSLWIHLSLLGLTHPAIDTRDVALYLPFHRSIRTFSVTPLRMMVSHFMRRRIGRTYEHPVEDARAALDLFRSYEDPWEDEIRAGGWPCALPPSRFSRFFS